MQLTHFLHRRDKQTLSFQSLDLSCALKSTGFSERKLKIQLFCFFFNIFGQILLFVVEADSANDPGDASTLQYSDVPHTERYLC